MKLGLIVLLIFMAPLFSYSQSNGEPSYYFGLNLAETRAKLKFYQKNFGYKISYTEYDSSIEITISTDSAAWVIYSVFYFDKSGKCYSITNRYCGPNASKGLEDMLSLKDYKWEKLSASKYLSKHSKSEQLEILDDKECTYFRNTKLTRKEYKRLKGEVVKFRPAGVSAF